jgi:hypothetical protein
MGSAESIYWYGISCAPTVIYLPVCINDALCIPSLGRHILGPGTRFYYGLSIMHFATTHAELTPIMKEQSTSHSMIKEKIISFSSINFQILIQTSHENNQFLLSTAKVFACFVSIHILKVSLPTFLRWLHTWSFINAILK